MSGRLMLSLVAALLAATPARAASPPPPLIPVEAFGALPSFSNPHISPDGKRVLAIAMIGGERAVVVYDLAGDGTHFTRLNLGSDLEVMEARWAGDHRVLLSIYGTNQVYGLTVAMTRLFLRDLDTGLLHALGGNQVGGFSGGDIVYVDPAGAYVLLAAQATIWDAPSVLRVDLATLKTKELMEPRPGVWSWYADANGVLRAGLGSDTDSWWLYYRDRPDGAFRRITGKRPGGGSLFNVETLVPLAGSDKGYVIANKATGRYGVYRYDFATDTIGEPVFEHPKVDVDGLSYSLKTGEPDAIEYADDRDRIQWLDPAMQALQARLDRALPDRVNRIVSRDADDNRMIVWSASASDPGIYYLFERAKGSLTEMARPFPALEGKALAPVEAVSYKARDGLAIPAYLTRPAGRRDKGLPLVVMPHGGPFLRDKWEYDSWVQFLANRGYVVLQPNYRGSTGYGRAFVDAASGEFGRKMQDDLDDGVAWLARTGLVDPKRVCIMGGSYGGYAALWAAARNPDIYRCAISFAGISEVKAILHYDPAGWSARRYYCDWRDRIRGADKFDLDAVSPISRAASIKVPLLIAHGGKDMTVPVDQSKRMDQALRRAGIDHEFVLYPDEKHGFSKAEDSIDFLRRVEAFLAKHNPAG
jgi:dipeptidyl aminopeptidase/acylaminoacyl peptidase